ncbi:Lactonase, 7-bladed beta-propeller-domain-containing protein [Annulohypoxylon moriforme]|nr:Lactonase, 7-bladed beta-propeller-domain-containing protein [Annulohypoxylon moriforme]
MKRMLLISGDRADITTLSFDPAKKELSAVANYLAPPNVSWVEPSSSHAGLDRLIGMSEGLESGLLYTFEIDHAQKTCKTTSQQPTLGAPAHFITLQDGSALALGTYLGGSAALYPISITEMAGFLLEDAPRSEILLDFSYKSVGHGPNQGRQRQCHVHQILEDRQGLLYAPDLGADRVWVLRRDQMKLEVCGWLQCPPGTGARHAVFTLDEKIMYVIGELSHTVIAFELPGSPAKDILPIQGFAPNVIPPSVHPDHQFMMDSSEICLHPNIPNVLYVTNRWERHIAEREPHLKNVPKELPPGDAIAIILLSYDGRKVQDIKFVRTNLDTIRGMRLSEDGSYVVVVGQEGGGVEIYGIGGERGDVWTLVASLNEGLESGIKHAVWL